MKAPILVPIAVFTSLLTTAALAQPATAPTPPDQAQAASAPAPAPASPFKMPVYHPPGITGSILPVRVGGGSRGGPAGGVNLEVLVPDQAALTTQPQPSLYWYQSKAANTLCELTLTEPKKAKPLLVLKSSTATKGGIHSIKLADFKVKLKPKVVYKWSVAVVVDPQNRSQDVIANGIIEYVEPTPDLAAKLASASDSDRAAVYAEAGIWYDALDALSTQIAKNPQDMNLQDQRAEFLKQIGLDGATIEKTAFAN